MPEVWLKTNTRALTLGLILPAVVGTVGSILAAGLAIDYVGVRLLGGAMALAAALMIVFLGLQMRRSRLAYADEYLLVSLRTHEPIRVPIDFVEAFFLGRGPSMLPGRLQETPTANLIIRLADRAGGWAQRDVKPMLGSWCDGYITIRGAWCEPLNVGVANRLNQRLAEVKRERHQVVLTPDAQAEA